MFLYKFISKTYLKLIKKKMALPFKNNASDKRILTFSLDLTLCCELQRHEINLIIKVSIEFTYFLIQK